MKTVCAVYEKKTKKKNLKVRRNSYTINVTLYIS